MDILEQIPDVDRSKDVRSQRAEGHVREHYRENNREAPEIQVLSPEDLPEAYREQFDALSDERLEDVRIAVVPNHWKISESSAENQIITFQKEYFESGNKDDVRWMAHELGHCQYYLDIEAESEEERVARYQGDMQAKAFPDISGEYTYPNNYVEAHAFQRQFEAIKRSGIEMGDTLEILKRQDYDSDEDMMFLERIAGDVYEESPRKSGDSL